MQRGMALAADGRELQVARFPAAGSAWASLVFAGAMGVRQDFYWPFARFLAAAGIHVMTFDYRGSGYSRQHGLARERADVSTWAEQDLDAMLLEAQRAAPELPLLFAGHSLGGQLLGTLPHNERVSAAITVTAGSGYYRFNDRMPLRVRIFWFAAIPLLTPVFGYFPGRRIGMVGDLPAGVAWQWRRWCLHPDYLLAEGERYRASFDRVRIPILSHSFGDDDLITAPAIDLLHSYYRNAAVERRHHDAAARVGHFGFFSERSRPRWQETLEWLESRRPR